MTKGYRTSEALHAYATKSVPTQEEIDSLGGGKTIRDWEARFELAYQKCENENVTLVGGVAPTATRFARYLKTAHGVYPKDLWETQIVTLGSAPDINTRYRPALRALYGNVAIRETGGGATECMFGQQMDEKKGSRTRPNYDLYFFEVETRSGVKMLHEMRPGEMGSMVVSTPVLPRYKIGGLIRASPAPPAPLRFAGQVCAQAHVSGRPTFAVSVGTSGGRR